MKTKPKSAEAVQEAATEHAVTAALNEAYGPAAGTPRHDHPISIFGNRTAPEAAQIVGLARKVGLPEKIVVVCEVTLQPEGQILPEVRFLMPRALSPALGKIGDAMEGKLIGPGEGLAALLGSCGRGRFAWIEQARPPEPEAGPPGPNLENAIDSVLGLLRMAEAAQNDAEWVFERNSPVWMLFQQTSMSLEAAWEAESHHARPAAASLAVQVLETGTPGNRTGGAA